MKPPLRVDDAALVDALSSRKPSELVSVLLEISRRLSARRRPADVLAQYGRDAFVSPSAVDLRDSVRFDAAALDAAAAYEAVLLSPLAPLATCSVVSPTTQDRSVTTSRTTEVVSDPTNVLALEAARRLMKDDSEPVRLCTLHQVVRPQRFGNARGFSQHFRMFALADAGLSRPEHAFEVDAVVRASTAFLDFFDRAEALGCRFPNRRARLLVGPSGRGLADRVRARLTDFFRPDEISEEPLDSGYYDGLRLLLRADAPDGNAKEIADIGMFDWIGKLTSNRRHRLVAAGLGIQLAPLLFRS